MTKETVTGILNQKASEADSSSKQTDKAFIKGEIDLKSFMSNYVDQRKEYHKYKLLTVKVHQQ